MVPREYWWVEAEGKAFKNSRVGSSARSKRNDLSARQQKQEAALDASSSFTNVSAQIEEDDSFAYGVDDGEDLLSWENNDTSQL